jgi:thiamine pyrophosphokinase
MLSKPFCLIITGGFYPHSSIVTQLAKQAKKIIACDGGVITASSLSITPDHLVGDFDTISLEKAKKLFPNSLVHSYKEDKDFTDTELGIQLAKNIAEQYILLGGGGGRIDHFLAINSLLYGNDPPQYWIAKDFEIFLIDKDCKFEIPLDHMFSIFPLGIEYNKCKTTGLKWSLDFKDWSIGEMSISNEATEIPQYFKEIKGKFALIHSLENTKFWGPSIYQEL